MLKYFMSLEIAVITLLAFVLTTVVTYVVLLVMKKIKVTQIEREEGPESHKKKSGTPTMGGIGFVIVIALVSFLFLPQKFFPLVLLFFGFALIGLADDMLKVIRQSNQGLSFWQKIIFQLLVAAFFSLTIIDKSNTYFLLLSLFAIIGGANATNLTDGLDGLLAGSAIVSFICFGFILSYQFFNSLSLFSFIVAASLFAFLLYNICPNKKFRLFMGDTGSLAIGAALSGLAIITNNIVLLIILAALFIIEALSVIIQVLCFKAFKKRVFKMAPLHHHFELLGWSEERVVLFFWELNLVFCLFGVLYVL